MTFAIHNQPCLAAFQLPQYQAEEKAEEAHDEALEVGDLHLLARDVTPPSTLSPPVQIRAFGALEPPGEKMESKGKPSFLLLLFRGEVPPFGDKAKC